MEAVGLIGLGSMGRGVAASLLRAGLPLHAYDVRQEALQWAKEQGATPARSPAEAGAPSMALTLLVVDADQIEDALFGANGAAAAMKPGSVVISSSTVPPAFAAALGARLRERGLEHIDAPVSGGAAKAAQGQLSIMA